MTEPFPGPQWNLWSILSSLDYLHTLIIDTEEGETNEYPTQRMVEAIIEGTIDFARTMPK